MFNNKIRIILLTIVVMVFFGACSNTEESEVETTSNDNQSTTSVASTTSAVVEVGDPAIVAKNYYNPDSIVSVDWLNDHLQEANIKIIDVRKLSDDPEKGYQSGHIPGSINIPGNTTFQVENDGVKGVLPTATHIEDVLSQSGIKPDDTIIFYDDIKSLWASRAYWGMEVYGHKNIKLLDGDIKLWTSKGLPISKEVPEITVSNYVFTAGVTDDHIIGWEEVKSSIENDSSVVCDTRSPDEYSGKDVRAERGGHIPGSINVNWVGNAADDGTFLPAADLKKLYANAQIGGDKGVYTLCQTAVRATHTWFVLHELLGYDDVRVYDGSWTEWGNKTIDETPIDIKA
jgi:thiosulfate/3-mercaptopyruvate sulfurtransferase